MTRLEQQPRTHWIIFAHGSKDPAWHTAVQSLHQRLLPTIAPQQADIAYLEINTPLLPDILLYCANHNVQHIKIIPFFISPGRHLRIDLPQILKTFQSQYPHITIDVFPTIGEMPQVVDAIIKSCL